MAPEPARLKGKVVLVTGGTGSFGTAFVDELLDDHEPAAVRVYSRDELKQYELRPQLGTTRGVRFFLGDVRNARAADAWPAAAST